MRKILILAIFFFGLLDAVAGSFAYAGHRFIFGTASQFESNAVSRLESAQLDTDKFVVCYADVSLGQCIVGVVTGTTIAWGAEVQFSTDVAYGTNSIIGVCQLDTDKFAVVFGDDFLAEDGQTIIGSVAGDVITFGAVLEFVNSDAESMGCAGIATDKYIVTFNDETAGDVGTGVACTAAGTVATCGTINDYAATDYYAEYNRPSKLDTDKFVVAYRGVDATDGYVIAGTTSGTTITWGSVVALAGTNDVSNPYTCSPQDADRFAVVYTNETGSAGEAVAGTTSGTVITLGAAADFNPTSQDTGSPGCAFISATEFVVTYPDVSDSSLGKASVCTVDWSTRDVSCLTETTFTAVDVLDILAEDGHIVDIIDGYGTEDVKFVAGYIDTAGTDDGYAIIGRVLPRRVFIEDP